MPEPTRWRVEPDGDSRYPHGKGNYPDLVCTDNTDALTVIPRSDVDGPDDHWDALVALVAKAGTAAPDLTGLFAALDAYDDPDEMWSSCIRIVAEVRRLRAAHHHKDPDDG